MRASKLVLAMPKKRRGFTLVETLLAMVVFGIILYLATASPGTSARNANVRSLAEEVAEEIRLARELARSSGIPTGISFPSGNGSGPYSQSLYHLSGLSLPDINRVRDYSDKYSEAFLFIGHWSGPQNQVGTLPLGANDNGFRFAAWGHPNPNDWTYAFLPSGLVVSDRPSFDGNYHIVVAKGFQSSNGSVSGTTSFNLAAAEAPMTITITSLGDVFVEPGIPSGSAVASGASAPSAPSGTPPGFSQPSQANPSIGPVMIQPVPIPHTLPPGVDATVREDGYLTLLVESSDVDGDELLCRWSAINGSGAFSSAQETRMTWDSDAGLWRSVWEWAPPPNSAGQRFVLNLVVRDRQGGTASGRLGVNGTIEVLGSGAFYFWTSRDGNDEIYKMNSDGTRLENLTNHPANERGSRCSPDGGLVAFSSDRTGTNEIYTMSPNGANVKQITNAATLGMVSCDEPCWSPDGSQIAFRGEDGTVQDIFLANADGTDPSNPATLGARRLTTGLLAGRMDWRPDGDRLMFAQNDGVLYELQLDGTLSVLHSAGVTLSEPRYSPNIDRVVWHTIAAGNNQVWIGNYNLATGTISGAVQVTSGSSFQSPAFSPAGDQLVIQEGRIPNIDICRMDLNGANLVRLTSGGTSDDADWAP